MLIEFEGTDGCGKATQVDLLEKFFKEKNITCTKLSFPNYENNLADLVVRYLNGDFGDINSLDAYQVNSFYAVNRLATIALNKEAIKTSTHTIFDRYVGSTMLHQSALFETQDEIDKFLDYVDKFEFEVLKLPRPDVVVFLDMPVEFSKKLADSRGKYKSNSKHDIYEENVEHLKKAYNAGKYVAEKYKWITIPCVKDGKIKSIEEIHNEILTKLKLKW